MLPSTQTPIDAAEPLRSQPHAGGADHDLIDSIANFLGTAALILCVVFVVYSLFVLRRRRQTSRITERGFDNINAFEHNYFQQEIENAAHTPDVNFVYDKDEDDAKTIEKIEK